ncbi:hypothetical protein U1Q18_051484 [Sarracenia purpurea var. burkii]
MRALTPDRVDEKCLRSDFFFGRDVGVIAEMIFEARNFNLGMCCGEGMRRGMPGESRNERCYGVMKVFIARGAVR